MLKRNILIIHFNNKNMTVLCMDTTFFQTYDLLRLCVYSFQHFCEYYLARHPGYYVTPLKLNGSAIESLFSQIKYNAGKSTEIFMCNFCT